MKKNVAIVTRLKNIKLTAMKKLLLFLLLTSLSAFSQSGHYQPVTTKSGHILYRWQDGPQRVKDAEFIFFSEDTMPAKVDLKAQGWIVNNTPDTLRAILLITLGYRQQGIAHARMGYVVIEPGKPVVYLDCRKKSLKWPVVGWDFREVDVKYKSK